MTLRLLVFAAVCIGLTLTITRRGDKPTVDGEQLKGFEVAEAYMLNAQKDSGTPFILEHFTVTFQGDYDYWFVPKLAPGEKPSMFMKKKYGWVVHMKVDPKTWKVTLAEAQP